MYTKRDFTIKIYKGDKTFKMLSEKIGEENINIASRKEHVGMIKRSIRIVKELINGVIKWTNSFPNEIGIKDVSPDSIVSYNCFKSVFGAYVQVFYGTNNIMGNRIVGDIALRYSNEHVS